MQYSKDGLDVDIPSSNVTVFRPKFEKGLADESAGFRAAVRDPICSDPLSELIEPADRIAVIIPDITRPLPSDRLLPWLFAELAHVPAENFTIVIGTGSHRANTPEEIQTMVGMDVAADYRIINHNAYDRDTLEPAGKTRDGRPVLMNKECLRADKRIVLGFIEPHFFAGYSGGYKGIFPAIADIESIMHYHRAAVIADARSTWGILSEGSFGEENPTQEQIRSNGSLLPVDFCINVTLNSKRQITRFFCGDVLTAHEQGCMFVKSTSMVPCQQAYPIVITTNSGYPLDQNLYQSVKGMSAAAQIVENGGVIIMAARCNDGFPFHGNFRKLLLEHESPRALLNTILTPGFSMCDQWEAQKLAMILLQARVALYSQLSREETRQAHLEPVDDISLFIAEELKRAGNKTPIAVLPEGPMTIPYLVS